MFRITFTYGLLFVIASSFSKIGIGEAKTAVLFGATGAVGNEVLRSIIRESTFKKVVLVGRRFPPKVMDLLPESSLQFPEVVKVQLSDLRDVEKNEELNALRADACFIAVGAAFPHLSGYHDWHSVEVDMVESITRLCSHMNVKSITLFTSTDAEISPEPLTKELVNEDASNVTPIGWLKVFKDTFRIMGLKEKAILSNSKNIPFVRIFQPSTILTKELRYGWLDWSFFQFHSLFDPWLPLIYHSVTAELLGTAMVKDSVGILSGTSIRDDLVRDDDGATRLTYEDFVRISAIDFEKLEESKSVLVEEENTEL